MDQIGKAVTKAVESRPASSGRAIATAPARSYTADNLPLSLDRFADVIVPNRLWRGWIPKDGKRPIGREMTLVERTALEQRVAALEPALLGFARPAEDDRVMAAIDEMIASYSSTSRLEGAALLARLRGFVECLSDLPAWAIEEACFSIRRYGYEVVDGERKRVEQTWLPSEAQVHAIVVKVVSQRMDALASARALLAAPVEPGAPEPPPAGSVEATLATFHRARAEQHLAEIAAADERREKQAAEHRRKHLDAVIEDYRRAGLDPPKVGPGGIVTSLPMMLKMGWRIEEVGFGGVVQRQLVSPAKVQREPSEEGMRL